MIRSGCCPLARQPWRVPTRRISRLFPLVLAVFVLAPCRNALADAPPSSSDSDRSFRVISPAKGARLSSLPVEIKLFFPKQNRLDFPVENRRDQFRAELNGVDVTRRFGPLTNHVRRARFYPRHLNLGSNSFTAHYEEAVTGVQFAVQQPPGPAGSSQSQQNYIPITTRIVSGHGGKISDYGVQVNGQTYFAPSSTYAGQPATNGYGFQVLVLDRATLNVVSNTSFGTPDDASVNSLVSALAQGSLFSGCGEFGCLIAVQSFAGIGAAGDLTVNFPNQVFASIGGSGTLALQSASSSYSLIAAVTPQGTAPAGTGYERVCSTQSAVCRSAVISGALILDNYSAYTFASPARVTFSTGTAPNSTSNTITVGANEYPSSTVASGQGGFQLVVLDSQTLTLISNQTFTPLDAQQLNEMSQIVSNTPFYNCLPESQNCPIFILSSIGNVAKPTSGPALKAWLQLGSTIQQSAGGTYNVFESLGAGDDYALLDAYSAQRPPATEASSVVSRAVQPLRAVTLPSNIRGELIPNHQWNYAVSISNLSSTFNSSSVSLLDATALQAPVAWPYPQPGHTGQQNAYVYFSQLTCTCNDIRSSYNNLNATLSDWFTTVSTAKYTTNPKFTYGDFTLLQIQLKTELEYARAIQKFEGNFDLLYTQENSNVGLLLTQDYGIVQSHLYVPPPPVTHHVLFGVLTGLSDLFSLASYLTPLGPAVQFGFDAASIAMNTGALFTSSPSGPPAINQLGMLRSTYGNLAGDAANNFADGQEVVGNFFDLILSDWGRMKTLGLPLQQQTIKWDSSVNSAVLDSFDRATRKQYLISLMAGVFSIEHDLGIANGTAPTSFLASGCTDFNPGVKVTVNDTSVWAITTSPFEGQLSWDGFVFWNVPSCPATPQRVNDKVLKPLFAPLDPGDPSKLGQYGPWFYLNQRQILVYNP